MNSPELTARIVACGHQIAETYRARAIVICRDPREAAECKRLQAEADRCDALAARWEKEAQ